MTTWCSIFAHIYIPRKRFKNYAYWLVISKMEPTLAVLSTNSALWPQSGHIILRRSIDLSLNLASIYALLSHRSSFPRWLHEWSFIHYALLASISCNALSLWPYLHMYANGQIESTGKVNNDETYHSPWRTDMHDRSICNTELTFQHQICFEIWMKITSLGDKNKTWFTIANE